MLKRVLVLFSLLSSLSFSQNEFKVSINNEMLELKSDIFLNYYYELDDSSRYYLGGSYIKNKEDDSTNHIWDIDFKIMNESTSLEGFSVGIGANAINIRNDYSNSFLAIPFSIHFSYDIASKISLDANIKYSAKVLSFSDAKNMNSYEINANYEIINNGLIYLGTRTINAKYDKNSIENKLKISDVYAGFKFFF
jgi:hypothetical protein